MTDEKIFYQSYLFHFVPCFTIVQKGNALRYKVFGITVLKIVSGKRTTYNLWGYRPGGYND
jgi:hypothetical protein